jgi:hypothetical protein
MLAFRSNNGSQGGVDWYCTIEHAKIMPVWSGRALHRSWLKLLFNKTEPPWTLMSQSLVTLFFRLQGPKNRVAPGPGEARASTLLRKY